MEPLLMRGFLLLGPPSARPPGRPLGHLARGGRSLSATRTPGSPSRCTRASATPTGPDHPEAARLRIWPV